MTISARGHAKSAEDTEGRTLAELEVHVIKQWYDAKDKKLVEERGELYVTERNLSSAARAYHEENQEAHATSHRKLDDQSKKLDQLQAGVAAIAHAVGAGDPGDLEAQQKHQRAALAKTTKEIKAQQAQTAAGIGKMAYLRSDPTMMRFRVENVFSLCDSTETPDDIFRLVQADEQPLTEMQTSFAGSEASIPAPPPRTSPAGAPPGKEDTAMEEAEAATADVAMGGVESTAAGPVEPAPVTADKRVVQPMRRDVVMEEAQNQDAKGAGL